MSSKFPIGVGTMYNFMTQSYNDFKQNKCRILIDNYQLVSPHVKQDIKIVFLRELQWNLLNNKAQNKQRLQNH